MLGTIDKLQVFFLTTVSSPILFWINSLHHFSFLMSSLGNQTQNVCKPAVEEFMSIFACKTSNNIPSLERRVTNRIVVALKISTRLRIILNPDSDTESDFKWQTRLNYTKLKMCICLCISETLEQQSLTGVTRVG
jgi:hypothetical protein